MVQASSSVGTSFSIEAMTIWVRGKRLGEVAVALIGDDYRSAGLGDEEIGAGDADIGGDEFLAQHRARFCDQILHRREIAPRLQAMMRPHEIGCDLFLVEVDHRGDDVAWAFAPDLDDVLAEIGLGHLDACCLEMPVKADLLRHHGLALGDEAGASLLAELQDDGPRVGGARRVMHIPAARLHRPLIGFEIEVEISERMVLDGAGLVAQRAELRQLPLGERALDDEAALDVEKCALKLLVGECRRGVLLEIRLSHRTIRPHWRGRLQASRSCRPAPRRHGGT